MLDSMRKVLRRGRSLLPVEGFAFDRPLVLLQSDDWGRVGVPDQEGWEKLRELGVNLGERAYDFYTLETAEDIAAIASLFHRHRDSTGRPPCLGMNFILANVDFEKVEAGGFQQIYTRALTEGLPGGWNRPGLFAAYREGVAAGILCPALHGTTHFCRPPVERLMNDPGERGILLRQLWKARVPYIQWRMPWIGFEYWEPEKNGEKFLPYEAQESAIDSAAKTFTEFFSSLPLSACAPGYRSNENTRRAWARRGIKVAQNGTGTMQPPHYDDYGILHLYRSMDFDPATLPDFSVESCIWAAEECFARGIPAIVSVHSINFHSTLKEFRSRTIALLDQFLTAMEARHPALLYARDQDIYELVDKGTLQSGAHPVKVSVTKRRFTTHREVAGRGA